MAMSVVDNDRVLKVDLMSKKHAGIYKCIASGTDGGVNVAFVKIDVYGEQFFFGNFLFAHFYQLLLVLPLMHFSRPQVRSL